MMMTIKSTATFFWTKIQRKVSFANRKKNGLIFGTLLILSSCDKNENLNVHALKTPTGWGYFITNHTKIIIKQTVIPVISENKTFKTKEDALRVGNLVVQKLKDDLSPTVTKKDLFLLAVKI